MDPPIKSIITTDAPPKLDDFTPLAEFQEATPVSFFDGKPVLHFHAAGARALVPASQRKRLPVFRGAEPAAAAATAEGAVEEEQLVEQKVDVFVNSANFTLFSQDATCGVKIPYPLIGIHAVKTLPNASSSDAPLQAVYMQLDLQDGGADDETYDTVELTIIPPPPAAATSTTDDATPPATAAPSRNAPKSEAAALFAAISACAELHPDPADADDDDDEDGAHGYEIDDRVVFEAADGFAPASGVFRGAADGGLPPPMPGSSGWITADNVADYFDADGNWIGGPGVSGELGEGAGRVRGRDEAEAEGDDGGVADGAGVAGAAGGANAQGANGHGGEDDPENKRQRTE
ncbi:hypothetical protein RB595_002252 [Gaeumannomyces hyphopodioides]